ncbi:sigma-70 family RNA polymerase sigma factor [Haliangium sp.]|uniref:sigma-70 family RNA polymerase sigma factor n=1 Tax=Haliangium sp. TaxID=2663208 RepID=UPI003D0C1880
MLDSTLAHREPTTTSESHSSLSRSSRSRSGRKSLSRSSSSGLSSEDYLASYFRDLSEHELLEPEQEREIARRIEEEEVFTWEALLSHPSTTDYVLSLLEARIDNSMKDFRVIRRAATIARRARVKANREKLRRAARVAAVKIRALDLDRTHVEAILDHLDSLRAALPSNQRPKLSFSPKSQAYARFLGRVHESFARAAALRSDFVHANLRLVVTMARRYDRGGMPLADLIQEGNLGLMHAVSRFDYRRGLRFSTYACWWIRHAIGRALADKSRAVRIPVHMLEAQQQLTKVQAKLVAELGREPTPGELAVAAQVPLAKLNQMHRYLMGQPMSLDRPVYDDDDRAFGELLADPDTEEGSPVEDLTTRALTARVEQLMDDLSPIEADVLRQRFGLVDDEERTFREIGDQYALSRERIRQIQNAALNKLRRALEIEQTQ